MAPAWIIPAVSALTGAIVFWQGKPLLDWYPVPVKGTPGRIGLTFGFTVTSVIFGVVALLVLSWARSRWGETASRTYAVLGIGLAVLFTLAGIAVRLKLKRGPLLAWTLLNFLWGLGYGLGLAYL